MTELASLDEQKIHVDWHQDWDQEERRGAKYLINRLVSNHREWRGVVEDVVEFVVSPELEVGVAQLVVEELEQVAGHPGQQEGGDVEGERESSPATEGLAVAMFSQFQ